MSKKIRRRPGCGIGGAPDRKVTWNNLLYAVDGETISRARSSDRAGAVRKQKIRAIPHNSKCRYGERGATNAKPKAQIILDAAKVSAASGGNSEPKQGQRSQSARGFCPRSTMRVPQPDIIEHFGNADAVPQPPERCLSRKAGIVRCCPRYRFLSRAPRLVRWPMQFAGCSRRCGHPHPALRPQNTGRGTACSAWFWGKPLWYPRRQP